MTEEKMMLLTMKGAVSELPEEDQQKIADGVKQVKEILAGLGQLGHAVIGLAGLEFAVENEES